MLTESSKVALRTSSGTIKASTAIVSGTSEYSDTWTINDDCYLTIMTNGSTSGESYAGDITVYDLIVSTTDVPFEPYSNICPISGFTGVEITRTGRNLIPNGTNTDNGYKNSQYIKATDGQGASSSNYYSSEYFKVKSGAIYTLYDSNSSVADQPSVVFYDKDKNFISGSGVKIGGVSVQQVIAPNNAVYARCSQRKSTTGSLIQFEDGTVAHEAEEFGNTYSITWQTTAGTVYGGIVTINQDGTGTLLVDRVSVKFSDADWDRIESGGVVSYKYVATGKKAGYKNVISSAYRTGAQGDSGEGTITGRISTVNVFIVDSRFNSTDDWLTDVGNETLVYGLATPIEYTFTAQQITSLFGITTIWNSLGTFSVSYHEDPKVYVDDTAGIAGSIEKSNSTEAEVMSFSDGADNLPMKVRVAINPVQDLHGYANPWVGGAGKNLLKNNQTTKSVSQVDFTIYDDGTVLVDGTANATINFKLNESLGLTEGTSYKVSGCPSGGSSSTYMIRVKNSSGTNIATDTGSGDTFTYSSGYYVAIVIVNGTAVSNKTFKPMITLATETDQTFAPYENICPISGWDIVKVNRAGSNLFDATLSEDDAIGSTGSIVTNSDFKHTNLIKVDGSKCKISFSKTVSNTKTFRLHGYDASGSWLRQLDATAFTDIDDYLFEIALQNDVAYIAYSYQKSIEDLVIEDVHVFPITLPTTAYGGTLTINKDGSGRLVAECSLVTFDGSEGWYVVATNIRRTFRADNVMQKHAIHGDTLGEWKGNWAIQQTDDTGASSYTLYPTEYVFRGQGDASKNIFISTPTSGASMTVEEFKAILSATPLQVFYPLDTPITMDFTAQQIRSLLGENHIWADSGNVLNVVYYADTKTYIDQRIAELQALILENV